jgi:hypothetical protein
MGSTDSHGWIVQHQMQVAHAALQGDALAAKKFFDYSAALAVLLTRAATARLCQLRSLPRCQEQLRPIGLFANKF